MGQLKVTGELSLDIEPKYQPYFQPEFIEGILGKKVVSLNVKERDLFASGDSRLWHVQANLDESENIELYTKLLRHESADRYVGLLTAYSEAGLTSPKVVFKSPDDHLYIYRAVVGAPLINSIDSLETNSLAEKIVELLGQIHDCEAAEPFLKLLDINKLKAEAEEHLTVARMLLPDRQAELDRMSQFISENIESLSGQTPIHGDLNPWNLIDQSGQLGVIDFSEAALSQPEYDYGILLSSLDFVVATQPELKESVSALKNSLTELIERKNLNSKLVQTSCWLSILKHLWVIGAYGKDVNQGKPLANVLFSILSV